MNSSRIKKVMRKFDGRISFSRVNTMGENDEPVRIQIHTAHFKPVMVVHMSLTEFAKMITGLSERECKCELNHDLSQLNLVREEKEVDIKVPTSTIKSVMHDKDLQAQLMAPYEVDGWQAFSGVFNHRQSYKRIPKSKDSSLSVLMFRMVEQPDT